MSEKVREPVEINFSDDKVLNIYEAQDFITLAVEICFNPDGEYVPFMRQINREYAILQFFTDYNPMERPIDEVYETIYNDRDLHDKLVNMAVDNEQVLDMVCTAENIIEKRVEILNRPYSIGNAVMDYFQGKTSPVVAGLIEQISSALSESNSESDTTTEDNEE